MGKALWISSRADIRSWIDYLVYAQCNTDLSVIGGHTCCFWSGFR